MRLRVDMKESGMVCFKTKALNIWSTEGLEYIDVLNETWRLVRIVPCMLAFIPAGSLHAGGLCTTSK